MLESYTASIPEISPSASAALISARPVGATTPVIVSAGVGEYSEGEYSFLKTLHDGALNPAFIAARELKAERFARDAEGFVKASIDPVRQYRKHIAAEHREVSGAMADALATDPKIIEANWSKASKIAELIIRQPYAEKVKTVFGLSPINLAVIRELGFDVLGLPAEVVEHLEERHAVNNVATKLIKQRPHDFTSRPSLADPIPFEPNRSAAEKEAGDYIEALSNRRRRIDRKKIMLSSAINMLAAATNMLPTTVAEKVLIE